MTTNGERGTSFTAGEATVEASMDVPQKVKNRMYGSAVPLSGIHN